MAFNHIITSATIAMSKAKNANIIRILHRFIT